MTQLPPSHKSGGYADGHVDKENPAPMPIIGNPAAENRPQHRRHHHRHRPQSQRQRALLRRIRSHQQALRERNQRAGHKTLQHAKQNQQLQIMRNAAQPRHNNKADHRPHKHFHFAETARHKAGERYGNRIGHGKRGNHPSALRGGSAQIAGNHRHGHIGDGGIEHFHKHGQAQSQGHQHQPHALQRRMIHNHS